MLPAHVGLGDLHGLLGQAQGRELAAHTDDGVGLAGVALLQDGDAVGIALGAGRGGLALLVGAPKQQAKGAEQGGAVEGLAQVGHGKASSTLMHQTNRLICMIRPIESSVRPVEWLRG